MYIGKNVVCTAYASKNLVTKEIVGRGFYVYPKPTEIPDLELKGIPSDYLPHRDAKNPLPLIKNKFWCLLAFFRLGFLLSKLNGHQSLLDVNELL